MTAALTARLTISVGAGAARFAVDAELQLERGVLVLFGPSGAGKSLTIQALAGLRRPARGVIQLGAQTLFDNERGIDVPPHRRGIGYLPQHEPLFPFCDVAANDAFGLPRARHRQGQLDPEVRAVMDELGIAQLAAARPGDLSGGERKRVALARALVVRPRLLLLDEPFASIDEAGQLALRTAVRETLARHGTPAVLVTHDRDEALAMGDSLVRYERGRTIGAGSPQEMLRAL